jgi:hypothetical protein
VTGPNRQDTAERRHLTVMICDLVGSTALPNGWPRLAGLLKMNSNFQERIIAVWAGIEPSTPKPNRDYRRREARIRNQMAETQMRLAAIAGKAALSVSRRDVHRAQDEGRSRPDRRSTATAFSITQC